MTMNREQLYEFCIAEENKYFEGWDFSYIGKRMVTDEIPWSYRNMVREKMKNHSVLFDMGTGGGELLSTLAPLPKLTYATESYKPNIPVAKKRLEPLGVKVREIHSDENLLFMNDTFDLVINSHESYCIHEVKRILKIGGEFLTQQVGCMNLKELTDTIGIESDPGIAHWNLEYAVSELVNTGFEIHYMDEDFPETRFFDIGSIVYLAKAVPWQFPEFSVYKYFDQLYQIHIMIQEQGCYKTKSHRFIILATK